MRIVSLVPGATQIVEALGLRADLVGVTNECRALVDLTGVDAPVLVRSRLPSGASGSVIDGAVRNARAARNELHVLDEAAFVAAAPDLVIVPVDAPEGRTPCAPSFFDVRRVASTLERPPRFVAHGGAHFSEVFGSIRALGEALGRGADAARMVADLRARCETVRAVVARSSRRPRLALLSWIQPPIAGGGLLAQMVELAGAVPVGADASIRARFLEWAQLVELAPEVVVLAPCSMDLERTRSEATVLRKGSALAKTPAARWGQVHAVDGLRWFSAPGLGTVRGYEILAALAHPELPWPDGFLAPSDARPVALDP